MEACQMKIPARAVDLLLVFSSPETCFARIGWSSPQILCCNLPGVLDVLLTQLPSRYKMFYFLWLESKDEDTAQRMASQMLYILFAWEAPGSLGMFASSAGSDRALRMIFHNAVARALFACITEN